jgi:hypothetical protein
MKNVKREADAEVAGPTVETSVADDGQEKNENTHVETNASASSEPAPLNWADAGDDDDYVKLDDDETYEFVDYDEETEENSEAMRAALKLLEGA